MGMASLATAFEHSSRTARQVSDECRSLAHEDMMELHDRCTEWVSLMTQLHNILSVYQDYYQGRKNAGLNRPGNTDLIDLIDYEYLTLRGMGFPLEFLPDLLERMDLIAERVGNLAATVEDHMPAQQDIMTSVLMCTKLSKAGILLWENLIPALEQKREDLAEWEDTILQEDADYESSADDHYADVDRARHERRLALNLCLTQAMTVGTQIINTLQRAMLHLGFVKIAADSSPQTKQRATVVPFQLVG